MTVSIQELRIGIDSIFESVAAIRVFLHINDFSELSDDDLNKVIEKINDYRRYFRVLVPEYLDRFEEFMVSLKEKRKEEQCKS